MTQNQVAKVLKVSNKTILNWENGKTAVGYAQATMLSSLYGIPIDNIFLPNELTKS